ncbi:MAG TPA: VTT domain-containing protein [Candidatus Dormibacteraeota bacterium]|nr:VTT domain-containing protein [Candidatus Dormibacteraeota bacterium]
MQQLPLWLRTLVGSLGGLGLFIIGFFDSSVLSFPFVNDILLVQFTIHDPRLMPYYVMMATLGSLAGCFWLYFLAKKGGEAMYRRSAGARAERIRGWVRRNQFLSVAIPAILPPPLPFKPFVLAAGLFQIPLDNFALALVVGRGLRYTAEGLLAIYFGRQATRFLVENKLELVILVVFTMGISYGVWWWLFGRKPGTE